MIHRPNKVLMRNEDIVKDQFAGVGSAHAQLIEFSGTRKAPKVLIDHEY